MGDDENAVTVTVRLIKSFSHRNIKHVVFKDVLLKTAVKDFKASVLQGTEKTEKFGHPKDCCNCPII